MTTKQIIFAFFFTFLGAALGLIGMVVFDKKTIYARHSATPKNTPEAQPPKTQQPAKSHAIKTNAIKTNAMAKNALPQHTKTDAKVQKPVQQAPTVLNAQPNNTIVAYDLVNMQKPATLFSSTYDKENKINKVAVYTQKNGKKRLYTERLLPATEKFPPISLAQAKEKVQAFQPDGYPVYQYKFVTFKRVDIPYYYFQTRDSHNVKQIVLVNIWTGELRPVSLKEFTDAKKIY